jgi:hypothetical protein
MKGQLATEYLVILVVILALALVVVYLVGGLSYLGATFTNSGGNGFLDQNNQYWTNMYPLAITEYKAYYDGSQYNHLTLQVDNAGPDTINLTQATANFSIGTLYWTGPATVISPSQAATVDLTLAAGSSCISAGNDFISFSYTIPGTSGSTLTETSTVPLIVSCS